MHSPVDDTASSLTAVIQVGAIAAVLAILLQDIVSFAGAGRGITHREAAEATITQNSAWWVIYATIPIRDRRLAAKHFIIEGCWPPCGWAAA